jgi:hypothetical protein
MARNQFGFHSGALHDLQHAQLLDPTDKKILVEIRKVEIFQSSVQTCPNFQCLLCLTVCFCVIIWKAKELRKAAIRHCPKHHIAVKEVAVDVKTGDRLDSTALAKPLEVKDDATQIQEIPMNVDAPAPEPERKVITIETGARQLGGEKTIVVKAKTKLTFDVPKSAYEFEKAWYVSVKLAYFEIHFHCIHFDISRKYLKTNTKEFYDYLKVRPCGTNFFRSLVHYCCSFCFQKAY